MANREGASGLAHPDRQHQVLRAYRFAGLGVDVRIIGDTLDVIADGEIIATHQRGQRSNGYVTDPEHQPAHLQDSVNLWTRGYFLRQADPKVGPGTVATCWNSCWMGNRSAWILHEHLDLGKRSQVLLEQACRQLDRADRRITYTAVKNRITALRAQQDQRPQPSPQADAPSRVATAAPVLRATPAAPTGWPPRSASTPSDRGREAGRRCLDQHLTDDDMPCSPGCG